MQRFVYSVLERTRSAWLPAAPIPTAGRLAIAATTQRQSQNMVAGLPRVDAAARATVDEATSAPV